MVMSAESKNNPHQAFWCFASLHNPPISLSLSPPKSMQSCPIYTPNTSILQSTERSWQKMASQKCVYMGFFLLLCFELCTSHGVHIHLNDKNKPQDMTEGATWSLKKVAAMSKVSVPDGYVYGQGSGTGTGSGSGGIGVGSGSGSGSGNGVGYGDGRGIGSGSDGGSGYGEGHGYGSGGSGGFGGYPEQGCNPGYNYCPIVTHCGNCGYPVVVPHQPCQVQAAPMAHKSVKEGEPMALAKSNEPVHHEAQEPAMENGEMHH